jgi:outer membrane protein assembly factor BamB
LKDRYSLKSLCGGRTSGRSVLLAIIAVTLVLLSSTLAIESRSTPPIAASNHPATRSLNTDPPTELPGSDWPTYLGEITRNSVSAGEVELSSGDAANLTQLWNVTLPTGDPGFLQAEPVEVNNTVYIGDGNGIFYALNASTGTQIWQSPNLGSNTECNYPDGITSSATVTGGVVYVGGGNGNFYALNQSTGHIEWSFFVGSEADGYYNWASPLVLPQLGYVYIGVSSDCDNPLVNGGMDQVSLSNHTLVHFFSSLNATQQMNCSPLSRNDSCGGSIWGSPSYNATTNTVWAATGNGYYLSVPEYGDSLMEWNATTLQLINHWTIPGAQQETDGDFGTTPDLATPSTGPPMVFLTDKNGYDYALDRNNIGAGPVWQYKVSFSPDTVAPDAFGGGLVYVGSHKTDIHSTIYQGSIRAFTPTSNHTVWSVGFKSGEVYGAPVYANGIVVVAAGDLIDVLNSTTGHVLWNYTAANETFLAAASISHGIIYIGGMNGTLYAFGLPNPPTAYGVTFEASGDLNGATWGATLAGYSQSTNLTSLPFQEVNGTWSYSVTPPAGFTVSSSGGNVVVAGHSQDVDITFTNTSTYTVTFTETGLPTGTVWWVNVTGGPSTFSTSTTLAFSERSGTYDYTLATANSTYAPTAAHGSFKVNYAPVNKMVSFYQVVYSVTFTETGLPSGTPWSVTLNGTLNSSLTDTVAFSAPNGTFSYSITGVAGWHQTTLPYTGSVNVHGAPVDEPTLVFTRVTYLITFTETGLTSGTQWWVNLTTGGSFTSTTNSLSFSRPNGTYDYVAATTDTRYAAPGGNFTVDGAGSTEPLPFTLVTFSVTFSQTGLPPTTMWAVTLNGVEQSSTSASIVFSEANGTYPYVIADVAGQHQTTLPYSGSIPVDGKSVTEPTMAFAPVTYLVTFTQSGLPVGATWYVNLTGGLSHSGSGSALSFSEPNGTFDYSVATTEKTYQSVGGSFTVDGAAVPEGVSFSLVTYSVTFTETGLPSGTSWTVTLGGTSHSSATTTVSFSEPNATYSFSVPAVSGSAVNVSSGSVNVSGAPVARSLTFTPTPAPATVLGLPPAEGYALLAALVIVALLAVVLAVVLTRRRRKTPPSGRPSPTPFQAETPQGETPREQVPAEDT